MVGKNDSSGSYTYFRNGSVPGSGIISDSHATYTGVVSERRSGASKWMHQGVSGSNVLMTDASGNVTDSRTFDAFGKLLGSTGSSFTPFGLGAGFGLQHEGDLDGWIDFWRSLIMIQKEYTSLPDGGSMGTGVAAPHTKPRPMYVGIEGEGGARIPDGPINSSPVTDEDQSTYFNRVKPQAFQAAWEFTNHLFWLAASFVPIEEVIVPGLATAKGATKLIRGVREVEGAGTNIAPKWALEKLRKYLKATGLDIHHLIPRAVWKRLGDLGIDLDAFCVMIERDFHQGVIHGGGGRGGAWNTAWTKWLDDLQRPPTAQEVIDKAIQMAKDWGLE
ncbi:MAG: DUF2380 domain-containing protein [Fimbriimonadales bacterium]